MNGLQQQSKLLKKNSTKYSKNQTCLEKIEFRCDKNQGCLEKLNINKTRYCRKIGNLKIKVA